ncbi:MAG: hypothetical protein HYU36_18030 [Planctomycetes bacterium]|nr:hypothetical protein [Planctomycetota bacterium]
MTIGRLPLLLAATLVACYAEPAASSQTQEASLEEQFLLDWPPQLVFRTFRFQPGSCHPESLRLLLADTGEEMPFQIGELEFDPRGAFLNRCKLSWRTDLPAGSKRRWVLHYGPAAHPRRGSSSPFNWKHTEGRLELANGRLALAMPALGETNLGSARSIPPPIRALRGPDGVWFGEGSWSSLSPVWETLIVERTADGPIFAEVSLSFRDPGGLAYQVTVQLPAEEDYALIEERCPAVYHAQGGWTLDLSANYRPERIRDFRGYQAFPPGPLEKKPGVVAHLRPWTFAQIFTHRDYLGILPSEGRQDAVGLMAINGSSWRRADGRPYWPEADFSSRNGWKLPGLDQAVQVVREVGETVHVRFPLSGGYRVSGLAVYDHSLDRGRYVLEDIRHEASETPLSDVMEMILDWPESTPRPHLYGNPQVFDEARKRFDPNDPWVSHACAEFKALMSGKTADAQALRLSLLTEAQSLSRYWTPPEPFPPADPEQPRVRAGYVGTGLRAIEVGPKARNLAGRYDLACALGILNEDDRRRVRAALAFAAYKFADPEFFAPLCALGNFKVDGYFSLAVIALTFPDHPHSARWLAEAQRQLGEDLDQGIYLYESGAGNECEIYRAMSVNFLTQLALLLKIHGLPELAGHPRLAAALQWFVEFSVPPVPRLSHGLPRVLPFDGDTTTTTAQVYGMFGLGAVLYRETRPDLSKLLAWAWKQSGQEPFHGHGINNLGVVNALYLDRNLQESPPDSFPSRQVEGYGFVFHKDWGKPNEWMVFGKAGPASGHYHPSDGAVQVYAYGKPLVIGYGKYPYLTATWRYTTLRLDGRSHWSRGQTGPVFTSEACDAAELFVPVENVSRDREMSISELAATGQFFQSTWDSVMDVPPSHFARTMIYDRKGGYVVLYDRAGPRYPSHWFAHVLSDSHTASDSVLHFRGQLGVDLDLHLLEPRGSQPVVEGPVSSQYADAIKAAKLNWSNDHVDQQVVHVSGPPQTDYLAILHPRPAASPGQPLRIAARDKVWEVRSDAGTSHFICSREAVRIEDGDFRFEGQRGAALRHADRTTIVLLAGIRIQVGRCGLEARDPVSALAEMRNGQWHRILLQSSVRTTITLQGASGREITAEPHTPALPLSGDQVGLALAPGLTVLSFP